MNKTYYKKDDPTKVVTIIDNSQEIFYELSNGQMIKKDVFLKYYAVQENILPVNESFNQKKPPMSDFVDPNSFFTKSSLQLNDNDIQSLKNADPQKGALPNEDRTEVIINTSNKTKDSVPIINEKARQTLTEQQPFINDSIIQQVDESQMQIPNHTNTNVSQFKVFENDDDAYEDFFNKKTSPQIIPQPKTDQTENVIDQLFEDEKMVYGLEEATRRKNIRLKKTQTNSVEVTQSTTTEQKIIQSEMIDPTAAMFKTFKRNHDIEIKVVFNEKIGNPDFIKMMMDNMDGDIVGYYKKLIIDNIKNNFNVIEDAIEKQIKEEIFGKSEEQLVDIKKSIETIMELSKKIADKSSELTFTDDVVGFDNTVEKLDKESINDDLSKLIPSKKSPSGKQMYKYITDKGIVKDSLPESASKKGWKPLTKEE